MPEACTSVDRRIGYDADAIAAIAGERVPPGTKGTPIAAGGVSVGELAGSGLDALDGSLPVPLLLLREEALAANIGAMAAYCERHGVLLAPHGKTTMAPQIFARQIDAGAWAMTAATPSHTRIYRRFGVQRILLANQLLDDAFVCWLCAEMARDEEFEFLCLVDSVEGAGRLEAALSRFGVPRPIGVLVEVGYAGGRSGVRRPAEARAVAVAAAAARHLDLVGVECFEGMIDGGGLEATLALVDAQMNEVAVTCGQLCEAGLLPDEPLLSAGGSAYFDRVLEKLGPLPGRLVLRSGCYVTQDGGFYAERSPLAGRHGGAPLLRDALELWSAVLSRPEPELLIAGFGKRDAPYDMGLPRPRAWRRCKDGRDGEIVGAEVIGLHDQHAQVRVSSGHPIAAGDLLRCAISHPCGAFDRWRIVLAVDPEDKVVDAIMTFF